jgi:acyl carrier protein
MGSDASAGSSADAEQIRRWVVVYLGVLVGEDARSIDIDAPFFSFDIDSVDAVEMAAEFEKAFGCEVGPEFFLQSAPSVREMVPHLVAVAEAGKA